MSRLGLPRHKDKTMETKTLDPGLLYKMDGYWWAANYLSVGQIFLVNNPLLRRSPTLADIKNMLLGHWYTTIKGFHLKQKLQDQLIEYNDYSQKHGQDLPEIRN
jgi:phosphoketolase